MSYSNSTLRNNSTFVKCNDFKIALVISLLSANMKFFSTLIFYLSITIALGQNSHKLRRSDSYWGLHFDHHSELNESHLGKTLTEGMVDSLLKDARPDYIQVDCKGHPGVSSYPTLVGQQAASYDKDPLALIRKVTEAHNVALFVHYSGVIDNNYVRLHPEEGRYTREGKGDSVHTSLWGNYVDKLLIPQIKELIDKYHVDGAWVDGECWSLEPDYQPAAKAEYLKQPGVTYFPLTYKDPNYRAYLEFNRQKFISYLNHYTSVLHAYKPDFQICSNWAFSSMMPEPVTARVDFLSGDLNSFNALNSAVWNSRCLAKQGKPWDLLSWDFTYDWRAKTSYINHKPATQLCQEGAEVISMGGGYQVYFQQDDDLSFPPVVFNVIKDVADFIIPRKEFCFRAVPIPQIALLYSTAGWKNQTYAIYRETDTDGIQGLLSAFLDGQNAVEVLMTHQLKDNMDQYPVIVIPEWETIEPEMKTKLLEYVRKGGNVLVIGAKATRMFDEFAGVKEKEIFDNSRNRIGYNNHMFQLKSNFRQVELSGESKLFASAYSRADFRYPAGPAATITNYGKGKIACVYADLGNTYRMSNSYVIRDFLSGIVKSLYPLPLVEIKGSHHVHVVPTMKNGKMMVNLINTGGDHSNPNFFGFDEIQPIRDLEVSVMLGTKPQFVILQPGGKKLKFDFDNGKAKFIIPELKIHNIVEISK